MNLQVERLRRGACNFLRQSPRRKACSCAARCCTRRTSFAPQRWHACQRSPTSHRAEMHWLFRNLDSTQHLHLNLRTSPSNGRSWLLHLRTQPLYKKKLHARMPSGQLTCSSRVCKAKRMTASSDDSDDGDSSCAAGATPTSLNHHA